MVYDIQYTHQHIHDLCTVLSDQYLVARPLGFEQGLELFALANQVWLSGPLFFHMCKMAQKEFWDNELYEYGENIYLTYAERHSAMRTACISIIQSFQDANIDYVLIKGSANFFNGVSDISGPVFMSDLDILLNEQDIAYASQLLLNLGYTQEQHALTTKGVERHHVPPFRHPTLPFYVELHLQPLTKIAQSYLNKTQIFAEREFVEYENSRFSVLSPRHQLLMNILHHMIADGAYSDKFIDLRQHFNLYTYVQKWPEAWASLLTQWDDPIVRRCIEQGNIAMNFLFGYSTTSVPSQQAISHFHASVKQLLDNLKMPEWQFTLREIINGYRKDTILRLYGDQKRFAVFRGRVKHFTRHLEITLNKLLNR